jgi:hypothetical protein
LRPHELCVPTQAHVHTVPCLDAPPLWPAPLASRREAQPGSWRGAPPSGGLQPPTLRHLYPEPILNIHDVFRRRTPVTKWGQRIQEKQHLQAKTQRFEFPPQELAPPFPPWLQRERSPSCCCAALQLTPLPCSMVSLQYYDPELCRPALPLDGEYNEADIEWRMEQGPPNDAMDYLMRVRCVVCHVRVRMCVHVCAYLETLLWLCCVRGVAVGHACFFGSVFAGRGLATPVCAGP